MNDLSFELGEHWRRFVANKVATGAYGSPGETVEAALRLLESDDERLSRVADLLRKGEESGDPAAFDYDAFIVEARRRRDRREAA